MVCAIIVPIYLTRLIIFCLHQCKHLLLFIVTYFVAEALLFSSLGSTKTIVSAWIYVIFQGFGVGPSENRHGTTILILVYLYIKLGWAACLGLDQGYREMTVICQGTARQRSRDSCAFQLSNPLFSLNQSQAVFRENRFPRPLGTSMFVVKGVNN